MKPLIKTIGYVISVLCFVFGGLNLWFGIRPRTITQYDIKMAELLEYKNVYDYYNSQMYMSIGLFIFLLFIGIGIIVYIQHREKKPVKTETGA